MRLEMDGSIGSWLDTLLFPTMSVVKLAPTLTMLVGFYYLRPGIESGFFGGTSDPEANTAGVGHSQSH